MSFAARANCLTNSKCSKDWRTGKAHVFLIYPYVAKLDGFAGERGANDLLAEVPRSFVLKHG
jgi:hypothetical protein